MPEKRERYEAPPKYQPKRAGRPPKSRGAVKPPEHPDSADHARKCVHAARLRYMHNVSWEDIAASPWPLDDAGVPVDGAQPMWHSANSAYVAVKRYRENELACYREEAAGILLSHIVWRQTAIAQQVEAGDLYALQQHRAESEHLAKLMGLFAPNKFSSTTPDGKDAAPLLAGGGLTALLNAAKKIAAGVSPDDDSGTDAGNA